MWEFTHLLSIRHRNA